MLGLIVVSVFAVSFGPFILLVGSFISLTSCQVTRRFVSPLCIMLTCQCNADPLIPHFYIVKLGFTGVFIIFLFLL